MVKQKKNLSKVMKYAKILFLILWIFGIFIGGTFMLFLVTIFGLYMAITFRQTGREAMEQQKKLHNFLHLNFEVSTFKIVWSQTIFLFIGTLFFIIGLVNFLISLGLK